MIALNADSALTPSLREPGICLFMCQMGGVNMSHWRFDTDATQSRDCTTWSPKTHISAGVAPVDFRHEAKMMTMQADVVGGLFVPCDVARRHSTSVGNDGEEAAHRDLYPQVDLNAIG